jgi:hypothetical protein
VLNAWRYEGARNLGQSLTLYPEQLRAARSSGRPVRVSGCGFGCILIRRPIVERFPFHGGDDHQHAPDIPFAIDVLRAGIVSLARFDVACDHYDQGVRLGASGEAMTDMATVTALQNVNVLAGGQVLRIEAGRQYEVSNADAGELERAGFVRIDQVTPVGVVQETATAEPDAERAVMPKASRRKAAK